jgi:membrane protein YqaA with SNARE-associated domain
MTEQTPLQEQPVKKPPGSWLKRNSFSLFLLFVAIAITVVLFFFQDKITVLKSWGYLGAFLVSATANATIVLPMPSIMILLPMGAAFNPWLIGLAAGVGGAAGEMTAYLAGYSGRMIWHDNKAYLQAVAWLRKWGTPFIFLFAVTPMPLDVMGLAAGNLRYPAWKFFTACLPGKIIKYIVMALAGDRFYDLFVKSSEFRIDLLSGGVAAVIVLVLLALGLFLEHLSWKRQNPVK